MQQERDANKRAQLLHSPLAMTTSSACRELRYGLSLQAQMLALAVVALSACTPPTPRIDGIAGAPAGPSTPWTVPSPARTPPPPTAPPTATDATHALHADSSSAASIRQLSLTDVVDLALRNNPSTRDSWALARSAADAYGSARGALFPEINGSLGLGRTSTATGSALGGSIDSTQTLGRTSSGLTRTTFTPSLSLSYLVFDLGGRSGTIEAAKQRAIAADLTHNTTIQNIVLQAESTLFSYLATVALRDAQITAVQEATTDTAAAEARRRVGVGTLGDVLQTRTALAQARFQLATLEGSLYSARGNLAQALGLPANARFDVPRITANDSVANIAASVDTLINRAIVQRPDLAESRAEAAELAAEIRVARSAGYPALSLSSSLSAPHTLQGTSTTGNSYSLQLGVQIPIFNGFSYQYDTKSAREQYDAALARVASTQQQITVQVYASYAALQTATQRVLSAVDLLRSAQQSSDVAEGQYREGVGTIVDVLLARSALATARAEDIQARWEWRTSLAQLAHDAGSLDVAGRPNIPLGPP